MDQSATRAARRGRLWRDLTLLGLVGILLLAALAAGSMALYAQFYGPSAFVTRYLDLLSTGRAADALHVPGVAVDRGTLEESGIPDTASEALLRRVALAPLTDIAVESEQTDGEITTVVVTYVAGQHPGRTSFTVQQDGWAGVTPHWRFARSPLAAVELTLVGADRFDVNGFSLDRRQVIPEGADPAGQEPLALLVFTPGLYSVTVDTPVSASPGVSILADAPLATTPVSVQAEATAEFIAVVQERVQQFLTECTTQEVLQPTACPFGLQVRNRIASLPQWSIAQQPVVTVEPHEGAWRIPPTDAVAHIEVDIKSLFDGRIEHIAEDVPFQIDGTIAILPDGSASIRVGAPSA